MNRVIGDLEQELARIREERKIAQAVYDGSVKHYQDKMANLASAEKDLDEALAILKKQLDPSKESWDKVSNLAEQGR